MKAINLGKTLSSILALFCLSVLIVSCDTPACTNANATFDKFSPESKEYKEELAKKLSEVDESGLTYRLSSYQERDNSRYIYAGVQGDGLCATMVLTVDKADKQLDGIIKTKGMGYRGAELKGLKFDVLQDSLNTEFVYQEIGAIKD